MTGGYAFDVFLSYRRSGPGNVREWVHNHFYGLLLNCLADQLGWEPKIFLDHEVETGSYWPTTLRGALLRSRMLVAVWSPPYFRSPWCMAEWQSLEARERKLAASHPCTLVYPVIFSDRENFPPAARNRQARDLTPWSYSHLSFRETREYGGFYREMTSIAIELNHMLLKAPTWSGDWPIYEPEPPKASPPDFPEV